MQFFEDFTAENGVEELQVWLLKSDLNVTMEYDVTMRALCDEGSYQDNTAKKTSFIHFQLFFILSFQN